jgi:hypothetical protein
VLSTDIQELGLLEVREIVLHTEPPAADVMH